MASSMALRRLAGGILRRPRGGVTLSRQFSTTSSHQFSSASSLLTMTLGRGRRISIFEQVKFEDNHFVAYSTPLRGTGTTGEIEEDVNALHLKVNMPGLGKENVKVFLEGDELVILGKQGDDHIHTLYSGTVLLTPEIYNTDGITAEMKHGQLNISIPRIEEETILVRVV